ncbi:hypothetical protein HL658_34125 [Azospirillum sp. RWY-5-1]|uniref:Uncharacterized protein n=1 Tax=Azospirillum oleiclasticum TaxID=2735135 RepID=A0ABX2TMW6_9PROT|nr:hypothetical protein [Azospirillum oleiclasticum]NYZ17609.1 hypothetical protein [Azospirillum oleiclasticum]NYZ24923.1 hypothetical protein [Azospirillum oleiclasticum]
MVLRFDVDRNAFARLDILLFMQPSRMLEAFIRHFRDDRARADGRTVGGRPAHDYDVVVGPVSRLPGFPDFFQDYDQYCFRSRRAVGLLSDPVLLTPELYRYIVERPGIDWH